MKCSTDFGFVELKTTSSRMSSRNCPSDQSFNINLTFSFALKFYCSNNMQVKMRTTDT